MKIAWSLAITLLVVSLFGVPRVVSDSASDLDLGQDEEYWVDPFDMLNYDGSKKEEIQKDKTLGGMVKGAVRPISKSMGLQEDKPPYGEKEALDEKGVTESPNCLRPEELVKCQKERDELQVKYKDCKQDCPNLKSMDSGYFKQFVRVLLGHIQPVMISSTEPSTYQMTLKMATDDLSTLEKFSNSELGKIQDAHSVVTQMIQKVIRVKLMDEVSYDSATWWGWFQEVKTEHLGSLVQVMCVITMGTVVIFLFVKMRLSWTQLFF